MTETNVSKQEVWLEAMRPRTLPLALASIILGALLAAAAGSLKLGVAALAGLTAVLLQVLSNLANDYGDSVHGADHVERAGPKRAVQTGEISAAAMKRAVIFFALLSGVSGLGLIWLALGTAVLPLFFGFGLLGGAAIWAAVNYTAGNNPYGYAGLGDLFVLIFFGWVGVMGSYYLQTGSWDWLVLLPATSCGLFSVAVLNVNNIRDIESDEIAGKISIPVRLGLARARIYHWILLGGGMGAAFLYPVFAGTGWQNWLFLLMMPLWWRNGRAVTGTKPRLLNPLLKQTSLLTLAFVILFGLGQLF